MRSLHSLLHILTVLLGTLLVVTPQVCGQTDPSGAYIQRDGSLMQGIFDTRIKTVLFYQTDEELSYPILLLGQPSSLELRFDLLSSHQIPLWVSLIHCDASWKPSRLSYSEYLPGFESIRISTYQSSFNTRTPYVHYQFKFPNNEFAPKISGNYLLMVYERQKEQPILTRKFTVVEQKVDIEAEVIMPSIPNLREKAQQINIVVHHPTLPVRNPQQEIMLCVLKNHRWDDAYTQWRPTFVRQEELDYRGTPGIIFPGGNEYRHFTTRNIISPLGLQSFEVTAERPRFVLTPDKARASEIYLFREDLNGLFVIRADQRSDPHREAEYVEIQFSVTPPNPVTSPSFYVSGAFNDFNVAGDARMQLDIQTGYYIYTAFVKQGFYDYQYVLDGEGRMLDNAVPTSFEGNHFETENEYFIYLYYREPGSRYDRIVGFRKVNNMKQGAGYQGAGSILKELLSH